MIDQRLAANFIAYAIQVACIAGLGTLLFYVIRLDAPWLRHAYWRCLFAVCLLLPLSQSRQPLPLPSSQAADESGDVAYSTPLALTVSLATGQVRSNEPIRWTPIVTKGLAAGALLRLLWTSIGLWQLRRLRRTGEVAVSEAYDGLQRVVGTNAEIRYVSALDQPVTFGVWRPVVALPRVLIDQPAEIQRAVVCHELHHVRRWDWAWLLAEEIARAAFWFHPAVWWLISRIQLTREEVVDAAVVQSTGERRVYLQALMAFADAAPLTPAAAFSRRRHLFTRVVLLSKEAVMSSQRIVVSCMVAVLIVSAGSWYAAWAFPLQQGDGMQPSADNWTLVTAAARSDYRLARLIEASRAALQRSEGAAGAPRPVAPTTAPRPGQRVGAPRPVAPALAPAAGPLERQAKPITPENPIPRRTYSVPVELPAGASDGIRLVLLVRATIDQQGRVAEARLLASGLPPNLAPYGRAAIDAVKQWQYESPADAPISFTVQVSFNGTAQPVAGQSQDGAPTAVFGPTGLSGGNSALIANGFAVSTAQAGPGAELAGANPVRVGGVIRQPAKTRHVNPEYPAIAQSARVQGVVIIEGTIGSDGRVLDARVLRSIPLLDQAARDAVLQWEFEPTLLNGQPVPVIMTVTVQFTLPEPVTQ
jgi:protein TonB